MILHTITLHNFMSYAEATLDFSAISVACLCGSNGAGKSALLDAITWALWECARSGSDELIKLGEREMWVDLTFHHEGQRYRVRRSRQKSASKSGLKSNTKGSLEFQVWNDKSSSETMVLAAHRHDAEIENSTATDPPISNTVSTFPEVAAFARLSSFVDAQSLAAVSSADEFENVTTAAKSSRRSRTMSKARSSGDGLWRTLTGSSMRDTQKAINDLLRMDFETFVNSAYLRQGRADEFTMRAPGDRKQVLSDILGLSYFDRLQERAKDKARNLKARQEMVESSIRTLTDAESEISNVELTLKVTLEQFAEICRELESAEQKREHLQHKLLTMNMLEQRVVAGEKQLDALARDVKDLQGRESELLIRRTELSKLMERSPEITEAARLFESVKSQIEELDRKSLVVQDRTNKRLEQQTELARLRSRLELDVEHADALLSENEEKLRRLSKEVLEADKITESYERFKDLAQQEALLAKRQEAFVRLTQRANELHSQIAECKIHLEADLMQKEFAVTELQSVLGSKNSLEQQRLSLQGQSEALERLESEFELVEQRGLAAKSELESNQIKIEELKRRQQENLDKVAELTCHADSSVCPLCASQIVDRAAVIQKYKDDNVAMDNEIASLKHRLAQLEIDRTSLRKEYLVLKQRLESRKTLDTEIGQFNERLSAVSRAEENLVRLQSEQQQLSNRLEQQDFAQIERESLVGIKAEIIKLEFDPAQFAAIQSQIRSDRHIEFRYQQLQKDQSEIQKIEQKLPELRTRCDSLREQLETESYGAEIRLELARLQNELTQLSYDRAAHSALKLQLSELMPKTEEFRDLQRANLDLPVVEEGLASCRNALADKQQEAPRLALEIEGWKVELKNVSTWESEHAFLQRQTFDLRQQREDLAKTIAVTETELERLNARLSELAERKTELEMLRSEIDDYMFLSEAFGKKGIQAVIIENAIPEIEAEANRILSRLSDNKMHVALVTQQRTKSGGITETLDLLIGDDAGTRNYECFSGGEAFKVNFAIRVALSRLLARRSGAKLETLIIDEGFGSQDDLSRDRLVKAIRSIQSEFARILVITHFPDVREMFPMQIQVSKVHGASAFQLIS